MTADLILIGCTATKLDHRAPAAELYMPSDLFRRRRAFAETTGRPWAVLSARHGVVGPARELDPYNFTIAQRNARDYCPADWARMVLRDCFELAGRRCTMGPSGHMIYADPLTIEIHAGIDYVRTIELGLPAFSTTITLEHPVAGMQIGQQKQHYSRPAELPAGQLTLAL